MASIDQAIEAMLGLSATKAEQLSILQASDRAIVVFIILIAYVRIGKKRFLSGATAFDAILIIIIGSLSSRAISGTAPFFASLAATLVLILFHWLISLIASNWLLFSALIKGRDTPIIIDGRVNKKNLKKTHMSTDDLAEDLRQAGVMSSEEVREARLERSGKLSVIRK